MGLFFWSTERNIGTCRRSIGSLAGGYAPNFTMFGGERSVEASSSSSATKAASIG